MTDYLYTAVSAESLEPIDEVTRGIASARTVHEPFAAVLDEVRRAARA